MTENKNKRFSIIKKVAKHGSQAIIVIPKILQDKLCPGTIIDINIKILEEVL